MRARLLALLLVVPVCLSWPLLAKRYVSVDMPIAQPPRPDPGEWLRKSVIDLRYGNYSFSAIYENGRAKGTVHRPSMSAYLQRVTLDPGRPPVVATTRLEGPYRYTSSTATRLAPAGPSGPLTVQPLTRKRWERASLARFAPGKDPAVNLDNPDVTGAIELVGGMRSAEWERHGRIKGVLDASAVRRPLATFPPGQIEALGPAARSVAYLVTLDAAGRMQRMELTIPAGPHTPEMRWAMGVDGWGQSMPQKRPSVKNTQDVPADHYAEHS